MARDRKIRLRPIQATTQVDTNVPTGFQVQRPNPGLAGPSREAQMAKALEQLNPSLVNFASQVFGAYKEEELEEGAKKYLSLRSGERDAFSKAVRDGDMDDVQSPFWISGYQKLELKNLGMNYGLGLTRQLNEIPKDYTDEQFSEALSKYDDEFTKLNSLGKYNQSIVSSVFTPMQNAFKASVQQNWQGMRDQLIRERKDQNFELVISNLVEMNPDISMASIEDPNWLNSTITSLNEQYNVEDPEFIFPLSHEFQKAKKEKAKKEGIDFNDVQLKGSEEAKIIGDWYSKLINRIESKRQQVGDVEGNQLDISKFPEELQFLTQALELNRELIAYSTESGDFTKGNKLIINAIAAKALEEGDTSILGNIHLLHGRDGQPLANTTYAREQITQTTNTINSRELTKRNLELKNQKLEEEKQVKELVRGLPRLYEMAKDVSKPGMAKAARTTLQQTLQRIVEIEGSASTANSFRGFIEEQDNLTSLGLINQLEEDILTGDLTEGEFKARIQAIRAGNPTIDLPISDLTSQFEKGLARKDLDKPRSPVRQARNLLYKRLLGTGVFREGDDLNLTISKLLAGDTSFNPARAEAALQALSEFDEMLLDAQAQKKKLNLTDSEVNAFVIKQAREIGDALYDPSWDVVEKSDDDLVSENAWLEKLPELVSSEEQFKEAYNTTFTYYIVKGNEWDDNQYFYKPPLYDMLVSYFELQPMDVADFENALISIRKTVEDYYAKKKNK